MIAIAGVVAAQDPPTRIGRLNYVSGSVSFQPGGVDDWVPATINRPLTVGDQLYADAGARAEIQVPGTVFRLGSTTAFEFLNLDDRNTQVRLSEGALDVRVRRLKENLEVDTPTLAFTITRPGDYRIDTNPNTYETYVTVRNGEGQVTGNAGTFGVRTGEQAAVTGQDGAQLNMYRAPDYDDFDNWVRSRDRREGYAPSARYVSPDMVGYEDLDQYGSWRSVPVYGRCWVPSNVSAGWAPYHDGHWAWVDPWGWTWVDDEPWGFAPFHYGRWAHFDGFWGWVPGPVAVAPVYAPALVAWVGFGGGSGVSFGISTGPSVGWFPLGPRDVYIPAYGASRNYVSRVNVTNTTVVNNTNITNVYNNYVQTKTISTTNYMNRSVPGAVVAVPQNALATSRPVQQVAIRMQPSQINAMKTVNPAPHVAPQAASVLGRAPSPGAPRPPAAVLSKPVVAKSTPPPAPAPFQQRQTLLAQNPGHPIPIQQQQQIARAAPAATRPPVKVVAQARPVTPTLSNAPAPRPAAGPPAVTQHPPVPPTAAQNQNTPRPAQPVQQPQRGAPAQAQHPQIPQPSRPYEPPSVQQRQGQPAQAQPPRPNTPPPAQSSRPVVPPQTQRPPIPQPSRPYEPPSVQPRHSQPAQAQPPRPNAPPQAQSSRPVAPPQTQHQQIPQPSRPYEPPSVQQRQSQPAQAQPPRPNTPPPAQPNRPIAPPQAQPNRPQQQPRTEPQPPEQGRSRSAPPPQPRYQPPAAREQSRPAPPPRPEARQAPPSQERKPAAPPRQDEQKKKEER
jgi:hypothetical protein